MGTESKAFLKSTKTMFTIWLLDNAWYQVSKEEISWLTVERFLRKPNWLEEKKFLE